jgi:hypothetical protein
MRICCLADLHGHLPDVPDCDLLLIAGYILPLKYECGMPASAEWLDIVFRRWMCDLEWVTRIIGVAGNHDFIFEKSPHLVPDLPWTYLKD